MLHSPPAGRRLFRLAVGTTLIIGALSACNGSKDKVRELQVAGVWEQAGYGRIMDIDGDKLTFYYLNRNGCVRDDPESYKALRGTGRFDLKRDGDRMSLDGPVSNRWQFRRLDKLPASCKSPLNGKTDALVNFDYFWHALNDHYAFFAERGINWQSVYSQFRPRFAAATTVAGQMAVYEEILALFADAHVSVSLDSENAAYGSGYRGGLIAESLRSPFVAGDDPAAVATLADAHGRVLESLLLPGSLKQMPAPAGSTPAMSWGKLSDGVGYLQITRLSDLESNGQGASAQQLLAQQARDLASVDQWLPRILQDVGGSEGMVIDLRINFGGHDPVALRIASHFSNREQVIANVHTRADSRREPLRLPAGKAPYTKPLRVLTGGQTASAGEVLALALQSLPQARVIGEPTMGILSTALAIRLPNGGRVSLSNEILTDSKGNALETRGVQPAETVPAYANMDLQVQSQTSVDVALAQLRSRAPVADAGVLRSRIEALRQQMKLPGLSVAVIRGDKLVFEDGFGHADVDQGRPMTARTPVSLASITKTFVGTHLQQLAEAGKLNLDAPLNPASLGFSLDNPLAAGRLPTLRQLATHTSGIVDNPATYLCQYFIEDTGEPLVGLLPDNPCTQAPVRDPGEFLKAYLSRDGALYAPDNFVAVPGAQWAYSNNATTLAGFAAEKQTGMPLMLSMAQQLFSPLGLKDTAWSRAPLTANPPARLYSRLGTGSATDPDLELPHYRYADIYSGGMWSSAHDLARYLAAIANGGQLEGKRVLSEAGVKALLTAQTNAETAFTQGLFWVVDGAFFGHTGGDPGTSTFMFYNPHTKAGFVLLINRDEIAESDADTGLLRLEQPLWELMGAAYRFGLGI